MSGLIGNKDNTRRFRGSGPRPDLNEVKREEALERLIAWQEMSLSAQLLAIASRQKSGKDSGASKKQVERIKAKLSA